MPQVRNSFLSFSNMGNKWIWILSSVAYGLLSGILYSWICHSRGKSRLRLRLLLSSGAYTLFGLGICLLLWKLFAA